MKLRSLLLSATFFSLLAVSALAQEMVVPNKPFDMLDTRQGYITYNELNFGFGLSDNDLPFEGSFVGFTTTHAYQVSNNFTAGGGTGVLFYNGGSMLPLYLDFRYNIFLKKVTPYVFADGGLLFGLSSTGVDNPDNPTAPFIDDSGTRIYINPGVGVHCAVSRQVALMAAAGVWSQVRTGRESFVNFRLGVVYKPF